MDLEVHRKDTDVRGRAAAVCIALCALVVAACSATPVTSTVIHAESQLRFADGTPTPSPYFPNSWTGIHVYLPYDDFKNKYEFTPAQATADAPLYDAVWGSNSGKMVAAWHAGNEALLAGYYIIAGTDAELHQFGNLGHPLSWWQANHPDWILYECDQQTIAYVPGQTQVPLDISNPDVVAYLLTTVGTYAENNGYDQVSFDFVEPVNETGGENGGSRGCGVWTTQDGQQVWVQKFSGSPSDPAWVSALVGYLTSASQYLHGLPRPLAVWGNNTVYGVAPGDPTESQFVSVLDVVSDETGFADYGKFATDAAFNDIVSWAATIQGEGKAYLPRALYHTATLSNAQIEYAIAAYMMEKEEASAMTVYPYGQYGTDRYSPAYQAPVGVPCGPMYGGPKYQHLGQYVYYRVYSGGLTIVNTKNAKSYTVDLPQQSYTDAVTGQTVTSPLAVGPDAGFVLLDQTGCD
jgi:hypothetical protein